jgi:CheY-like chemotaxis protein
MAFQKRILVVDDDLSMCAMLTYVLGEYDYTVVIAHDGQQAVSLLATDQNFDLIFTDLFMPNMNGSALLEHIWKHFPTIPVIVSTTATNETIQDMCIDQEAADFLPRPFTIQLLHETIDRSLAKHHAAWTVAAIG